MNLVLCGMMGSGKSTVGKHLASHLSYEFVDTDEVLESRFGKITDIFARFGEEYFREKESEVCVELAKREGLVLATGGGLVLKKENVNCLKRSGTLIFLRANPSTLAQRLQADVDRPLLQTEGDLEVRIAKLLQIRTPIYESVADHILDVEGKTPEEIAEEIIEKLAVKAQQV